MARASAFALSLLLSLAIGLAALPADYASASATASASSTCPAGVRTACGAAQTCCPVLFSPTNFGCCPLDGAVCCGGQECCPSGHTCVNTSTYSAICVPGDGSANVSATQVCGPGPAQPASSSSLPSLVVNGDSVSIGQMPDLTTLLAGKAFVQHSPDAGGGGADDVGNGVRCAEVFWRDSMFDADPASSNWTLYSFNYGLHNLDNATAAETQYAQLLAQYADSLLARVPSPSRLLYVTTTPQMQFRVHGNTVVEDLNRLALPIMAARNIEVADLYSRVTAYCGAVYSNCSLCDDEWSPATNVTCGYHYSPQGWSWLASFMAPIYERKLAAIAAESA